MRLEDIRKGSAVSIVVMTLLATSPLAQALEPPGPTATLTQQDHDAFVDYWLDVFARGTRDINSTPESYDYTTELQQTLSHDVVMALEGYNDTMAHEFDPAVAGPELGISSPDDPLVDREGQPITNETIEDMYGGLIGNLMFRRADFYAELTDLAKSMMPTNQTEDVNATQVNATMMRNLVMEQLNATPIRHWDNDLAAPVVPANFQAPHKQVLVTAPPEPAPTNMTSAVRTSPFAAVPPGQWHAPGYHLPLRDLLLFLSGLVGLSPTDLIAKLNGLAITAHNVVRHVTGTLDSFPQMRARVANLDAASTAAHAALVPLLPRALPLAVSLGPLPAPVQTLVDGVNGELSNESYFAEVNGQNATAPFGVPSALDVDGDGVADVVVEVSMSLSVGALGTGALVQTPHVTITRAGADQGLELAPIPWNATVVFRAPGDTGLEVMTTALTQGANSVDITLDAARLGIEWAAVSAGGVFAFTAANIRGPDVLVESANGSLAPATMTLSSAADADPHGHAELHATQTGAGALTYSVLRDAPAGRLALDVTSSASRVDITSDGDTMRVDAPAHSALDLDRLEFAAPTIYTARTLSLSNAAQTTHATLGDARVTYLGDAQGATVNATVGDVTGTGYDSGAWLSVSGAGREFTFEFTPGGIRFGSIVIVPHIKVVVAQSATAALTDFLTTGLFMLRDDLLAFSLDGVRSAQAQANSPTDFSINVVTPFSQPFLLDSQNGTDDVRYLFSNLPSSSSIGLDASGLTLGTSALVSSLFGMMNRSLDGPGMNTTQTLAAFQNMGGTAAVSMNAASMNVFSTGSLGLADVLGSNIQLNNGSFVFDRLDGNHILAEVENTTRQYSSLLTNFLGNITGGLFGVQTQISLDLIIDGPLCESFGKDGTRIEICLSNVPDHIAIDTDLLPDPVGVRVAYNASDLIHRLSVELTAPQVDITLAVLEIPRLIALTITKAGMGLTMSSRLAAVLFTAALKDTTIAAGIEDLPQAVWFNWTHDGLTPSFDPNEHIGRVFLFLSQPDFAFSIDIVDIPLFTLSFGQNAIRFTPTGNRRIGSVTVQLLVENLTLLFEAEGIPGVAASWDGLGGTIETTATLDRVTAELTVGTNLSLLATIADVPPVTISWTDAAENVTLASGKIGELKLQFIAGDLLLSADARGVPALDLRRSGDGFNISAPGGIDDIQLILAKGSGYFDPSERDTDFVGLMLRPDNLTVGLSARVRGFEGVSIHKDDATKDQLVTLDFNADKDVQLLVNVLSSQIVFLLDALVSDINAHTSLHFTPDLVNMTGVSAGGGVTTPWLQARLYTGTPATYGVLPEPRWPFETEGLTSGIMGNTLIDAVSGGFATKWKVYAPLPGSFGFTKSTAEGIPQYGLNSDVALGKLDLRTMLQMDLNGSPLHTLAVVTVSNLPAGLSVGQGLGANQQAGNPTFTVSAGAPIDDIFLGIRFDDRWYGRVMAEDPDFIDLGLPWVEWEGGGDRDLGFPIWLSFGDIPTSISFQAGKADWSTTSSPFFNYAASASTVDASLFIDLGILWDTFVKSDIIQSADSGHTLPSWLRSLARYDASGHLIVQIVDIPAQGVQITKNGDEIGILVPDAIIDCSQVAPGVCPPATPTVNCSVQFISACAPFAQRLAKFFLDFNFKLQEYHGDQGCIICGSVLQLQWYWHYGWGVEIARLSLMLKDLKSLTLKPGITSDLSIDGEILFDFRAGVFVHAGAGIALHLKVLGFRILIFCVCLDFDFEFIVAASFITFQIEQHSWNINYWTWGWPCGWDTWCHKHEYAGVDYTIPGNWQFDLGIYWPPLVDFRGLHIDSSDDGPGVQHYKMFLDPIIMPCMHTIVGVHFGPQTPCFGIHIIPVPFYMVYAYLRYFSVDGPHFWSVRHRH